jgi:ubiquinone/menaquinone biosynthesis C-methylase UbiE
MNASPDWWKDFFSGLVVDFWRNALPPEVTRLETHFLVERLNLTEGSRVLDVPCGHGRLAIALARRGCRVTGVDISPGLLAAAEEDALAEGVGGAVAWRLSDMRDLPWKSEFDAAFCAGGSFGFLEDAEEAEFLSAVARALVPGGRFVLDASKVAESIFANFTPRRDVEKDGIRFQSENEYDFTRGRMENRYTITCTRDGRSETKLASHRIYTARQVLEMLGDAGLSPVSTHGSADGAPYRMGAPQFFVVCEKSGACRP